jgi:DNA primase
LTPDQARLIARYTDSVVIAYDSDNAGVSASQRGNAILEKTGLKVRVLRMDGAKRPGRISSKAVPTRSEFFWTGAKTTSSTSFL